MHRGGGVRLHRQAGEHRGAAVHAQVVAHCVTKSDGTAVRADATEVSLEDIEIQLLLEGIRLTYGYDFREYAMRPLRRNIVAAMQAEGVPTISAYQGRILHDATCMQRF